MGTVEMSYLLSQTGGLDPITVYWHDFKPGAGMVTIVCYGSAWTAYFGAMGDDTIKSFVKRAYTDYLVNKLTNFEYHKRGRKYEKYLKQIVEAVKGSLEKSS